MSESKTIETNQDFELHYNTIEIPTNKLTVNNWNPNFVPESMMKAIVDDIQKHGFIGSIVVQKFNKEMNKPNVIVNGEHRFEALRILGKDRVPCIVLDIPDKTAKLLTVRLNREHGELMPDKVSLILNDLVEGEGLETEQEKLEFLGDITKIPDTELELLTEVKFEDKTEDSNELGSEEDQESIRKGTPRKQVDDDKTIYLDWYDIDQAAVEVAAKLKQKYDDPVGRYEAIFAVANGGVIPARIIARELDFFQSKEHKNGRIITSLDHKIYGNLLVVDDIYDSGETYQHIQGFLDRTGTKCDYVTLVVRNGSQKPYNVYWSKDLKGDKRWVVFPWENKMEKRRNELKDLL